MYFWNDTGWQKSNDAKIVLSFCVTLVEVNPHGSKQKAKT